MAPSLMSSQLLPRQAIEFDIAAMKDPKATRAPAFYASTIPFAVLMVFFYTARMYSRLRPVNKLHWDDFFLTLAVTIVLGIYVASLYSVVITGGHHIIYIPQPALILALKLTYGIGLVINYPNILVKISISIMLLRIKTSKPWRIGLYILLGSLVLVGILATVIDLAMCRPISAFWSLTDRLSHCWAPDTMVTPNVVWYSYFAATDFILAMLPLTFIRQLNRPLREKIVLGVLMGFGLFTGVAAVNKTAYMKEFSESADYFYNVSQLSIWTMLELFIGIIVACVPCLKVPADNLLRKLGFQLTSLRSGTHDQGTARSRTTGGYGGGTFGASSKSGTVENVRLSALAGKGGPPADRISEDDDIGGVWDGAKGMADASITANAGGRTEKGGIVKDTHFTWETSSGGS